MSLNYESFLKIIIIVNHRNVKLLWSVEKQKTVGMIETSGKFSSAETSLIKKKNSSLETATFLKVLLVINITMND